LDFFNSDFFGYYLIVKLKKLHSRRIASAIIGMGIALMALMCRRTNLFPTLVVQMVYMKILFTRFGCYKHSDLIVAGAGTMGMKNENAGSRHQKNGAENKNRYIPDLSHNANVTKIRKNILLTER